MHIRLRERPDLITRQQAAHALGVTPSTISNYLLSGKLGGEQLGGYLCVDRADVEALKAGRRPRIDVDLKTRQRYSITRAMRQAGEMEKLDGIEWEMSCEYKRAFSDSPLRAMATGDYFAPTWSIWSPPGGVLASGLDTTGGGGGSSAVLTKPGEFATPLRPRSVALTLGARFLQMGFPFSIPAQSSAPDAVWLAENSGSDAAVSDETFASVPFGVRTLTAGTAVSRTLLMASRNSTPADRIITQDLRGRFGVAIDRAAIFNTGTGPTGGIINNAGTNVVAVGANGGPPTHDLITALEEAVALVDGDFGELGWATTPSMRRLLRKTQRLDKAGATAGAGFLWERGGMLDLPGIASRVVPSALTKGTSVGTCHAILFGAWDRLTVATEEAMTLVVDPLSKKKQAMVEIQALLIADVGLTQPGAFSVIKDATLT
jgi:HK97 family phage major capsid protein